MTTIVLCQPDPDLDTDTIIHIPSNVHISTELHKLPSGSCMEIVLNECGLGTLFSGVEPVKEIWNELHRILDKKGVLSIVDNVELSNHGVTESMFRISLQHLRSKFFMFRHEGKNFDFRKITTLEPNVVLPEEINTAIQNRGRLEPLFNVNGKHRVCQLIEDGNSILLGQGKQGAVYKYPKWRSDVAVKMMSGVFPYIKSGEYSFEAQIGKQGQRQTDDMLEVLSSATLNSLAIGQSPFGHSINIPRFDSFFTCHDDMEDVIDVYIVEELLDATFKGWEISHRGEGYDAMFKTMLWQCLYTLVMLGKMGWSHGDASFGNFMVKKVKPGYHVNNVDVGSATDWTFRLDGQEWKLKNLGYIAKITDFGFMQHFKDPKIKFFKNSWFESHRIPTDEVAAGADIGYFMISIGWAFALKSRRRMESMKVLFQDWFRLIKVKASDHMKLFDKLTAEGELKGFALESSRLDGKLEKHDVSSLLNSSYFDDVITH